MSPELWQLGAGELAAAIRDGAASSCDAVEAQLARIHALNPALNAIAVPLADEARAAAAAADEAHARGEPLGPLHGVPFTVKENVDVAGTATTHGVPAHAEAVAEHDAPAVAQLRAAGAIVLGRTNMPDFGMRWHTSSALRGATRNPWDGQRTPGGSSGGEAVALATGMTPLGIGNDYGGSLRYPSQCCGTVALRPTLGRVPAAGVMPPLLSGQLFAVSGPMARRVADLRIALAAMSGPDPRDPRWVPATLEGPWLEPPVRVAAVPDPSGLGVDGQVAGGVRRAADALADAGYAVEEREAPHIAECAELWATLSDAELRSGLRAEMLAQCSRDARRFIELTARAADEPTLAGYAQGLRERHGHARDWSLFLERYPLVLGPVSTEPPFPVGYDIAGREEALAVQRSMRLTVVANLLGLPAVAVPAGLADGLPQGVQLIGRPYREDLCLEAAQAIEDRLGVMTPLDPRLDREAG